MSLIKNTWIWKMTENRELMNSHDLPQIRNSLQRHIPKLFRTSQKVVGYPVEQSSLVFYR